MYKVLCDGKQIYNTAIDEDLILIEPKVTLEVNKAGSFEFKIPPTNPQYDSIKKLISVIEVYQDDVLLFCGRPSEIGSDFWKRKIVHCEGELAFLQDTIQRPAEYHDMTVREYLEKIISIHNAQVDKDKQFTVGAVTVIDPNDSLYRYTNWENTLTTIKEDLVDDLGGYIFIRHENGIRYIDYLEDYPNTNTQTIEFGENLLDFTKDFDLSDIATAVIPLGARLDESPIAALDAYATIAEVNDGVDYVYSPDAVATYGYIFRVVYFENVTTPSILKTKGEKYLSEIQWENVTIEAKAVDLHFVDGSVEQMKLGDQVRVVSKPHGMDANFPLTKMTIRLDKVSSNTITLGMEKRLKLEAKTASSDASIIKKINSLPTKYQILEEAKKNASSLIDQRTTGHVVTRPNEQLIMDTEDEETATKVWRWNLNGLGYSKDGYHGTYGLAMTMDGAINADFITTGTLNANIIRAGIIKDTKGKNYWNLETGEFSLSADSAFGNSTVSGVLNDVDEAKKVANSATKKVTNYYAQNDSATIAPTLASEWTNDPSTITWQDGKFIWWKTITTYVDGTTEETDPINITGATGATGPQGIQGIQGIEGKQGIQGEPGKDGVSTYFHIAYATSSDGSTGFSTTDATDKTYIGTYVDHTESDSTDPSKYTWQLTKGAQGEKGDQGIPGTDGTDGKTQYLHIAYATSSDGSTGFDVSNSSGKTYIGQYTDFTASDSTDPSEYSWSKIKGETGTSVSALEPQYYLSSSNTTQTDGSWSTTDPTWKSGYYIWTRTKVTWSTGTVTYTDPVLSKSVNTANQNASDAKQAVTNLDDSLTQQEIFNRLTNDGATQGIYLKDGKVYINADYISSGALKGRAIRGGSITIGDNFKVDNSGNLTAISGTIGGWSIGTSSLYSDNLYLSAMRGLVYKNGDGDDLCGFGTTHNLSDDTYGSCATLYPGCNDFKIITRATDETTWTTLFSVTPDSDYPVDIKNGLSWNSANIYLPVKIDSSTGAISSWIIAKLQNGILYKTS